MSWPGYPPIEGNDRAWLGHGRSWVDANARDRIVMPPTVFSLHGAGEMHSAVALVPWSTAPPTGLLAMQDLDSLKPSGLSLQVGQPDAGGHVGGSRGRPTPSPAIHSQRLSPAVSAASVAHRSASRPQLRPTVELARRLHVVITRAGHEPVVIISPADFESLRETAAAIPGQCAQTARRHAAP